MKKSTITLENGAYKATLTVKELAGKNWQKTVDGKWGEVVKWQAEIGDGHDLTILLNIDPFVNDRMWRLGIDGDVAVTERRLQHWHACVRYAGNAYARAMADDDDDYLDIPVLRLAEALGLYEIDRQDALMLIMDGADVKDRLLLPYYAHTNWGDKRRAGVVRLQDLQHADWVPEKIDQWNADLGLGADFTLANREHIRIVLWKDNDGKAHFQIQNGNGLDIHPVLMHARRNGRKYVSIDIGEEAVPAVRLAGDCKPWEAGDHAEQESARLFWRAFID